MIWGFSQPIEDNMEEAVSGVKGELATKVYGSDLHVLEDKANQIEAVMSHVRGITDIGVFQVTGQPDLDVVVDRTKAARWGINVADVQDAVQTAVGGNALTQVLKGEESYNLTLRYLPQYRDTREAIQNIRLLSSTGERVSLAQLCTIREADEGSEIYRENNQRYVAIKYSVRGRAARRRGAGSHSEGECPGEAAARLPHWLGGRISERSPRRSAHADHRAASRCC